ncbi:MAG: ribbon-helix-helix domain-containing protein [Armatimonadetes bacterium]|nr:ribbon-helix-helix domain-containing protein [Armatimonadota bacterium]
MAEQATTGRKAAKKRVVPVPVCFTPAGLKALDAAAKRAGVLSRSQFVRQAVDSYLQRPTAAQG